MEYRWELKDWLVVPVILFSGIALGLKFLDNIWLIKIGAWGCIFGSFVLAYLAYLQPKKDIVSILTPLYAILIFANPEFNQVLLIQVLYAISLTILVIRLKWRFSSYGKGDERLSPYHDEGAEDDENISEQVSRED